MMSNQSHKIIISPHTITVSYKSILDIIQSNCPAGTSVVIAFIEEVRNGAWNDVQSILFLIQRQTDFHWILFIIYMYHIY